MLENVGINVGITEAIDILTFAKKVPPDKLSDFYQFLKGVSYGIELAAPKDKDPKTIGRQDSA